MTEITISVSVGNESQSVRLTYIEWAAVQGGECLVKSEVGVYEGQSFTYEWHFNDSQYSPSTLVVTYDDGEGFIGSISDAWLN
jgi:hypothetical protein